MQKVAVFLMIVGVEKGQSIIALMDNSEIKAVVAEIRGLPAFSPAIQGAVRAEFSELGYEENMSPSEALTIVRRLFNGRKISGKGPPSLLIFRRDPV